MTENALTATQSPAAIMERVIIAGDLAKLTPEERVVYYMRVCESIGLNPLTRPFDYITLNGKLTLYPNKDAAAQLRRIQDVSITDLRKDLIGDIYTVTIFGREGHREDVATGAVNIRGLSGEALANAYMKAETKAKRRLSLSLAGLGFPDESEVEDIPQPATDAQPQTLAERVAQRRAQVLPQAGIEDGEPEPDAEVGDPMTEAESAAIPLMCGAEDKTLDTGECEQLPGHAGPHKNSGGVWPNR